MTERETPRPSPPKRRLLEPMTVLMILAVVLAYFAPSGDVTLARLDLASKALVFALFFFQGVRLSPDELRGALTNLRLHLVIVVTTFVLFPGLCFALTRIPGLGPSTGLGRGLLLLGVMPSTIQSSVIFTAMAGGNVAAAVCAASLSSVLGVALSPFLYSLLGSADFAGGNFLGSILGIASQLLLPLILGQIARRWLLDWTTRHRPILKWTDQSAILLIVYTAFAKAFEENLFGTMSLGLLGVLAFVLTALFGLVLLLLALSARPLGFDRGERIAIYFCGSKKSLASGAPIAKVLVPSAELSAALLPLMLYHQIQLLICAWLAARWGGDQEKAR